MRRARVLLIGAGLLLAPGGCGTIVDLGSSGTAGMKGAGPHLYGGTRFHLEYFGFYSHALPRWCSVVLGILDFPLSLVLDTAVLPVSLTMELFRGDDGGAP